MGRLIPGQHCKASTSYVFESEMQDESCLVMCCAVYEIKLVLFGSCLEVL